MPGLIAVVPAIEPAVRDPLWNLRNAAVPLLLGMPGDRKPVTFVEDTAVAPERLPEFVQRFRDVLKHHGTDGAFYGHAQRRLPAHSAGAQPQGRGRRGAHAPHHRGHHRPGAGVRRQPLAASTATAWPAASGTARCSATRSTTRFARSRTPSTRTTCSTPARSSTPRAMTENLRYGPAYHPAEPPTFFDYSKQEGFVRSIELCNGSGVCRKMQGGTMCPSFRATRDEKDSTRGRANALRLALTGEQPLKALRAEWVHDVLDLCLMCKACKSECPSNVDLAKLKAELLSLYYQDRQRPLGHWLMANIHRVNRLASLVAAAGQPHAAERPVPLAAGESRRHRPPPQPAGAARRNAAAVDGPPPLGAAHGPARCAAARRLLHQLQRAAHRPGRRGRARGRRLHGAPRGRDLLRPGPHQQRLSCRGAPAHPSASPAPGRPGGRRHPAARSGAELPAHVVRRMARAGTRPRDADDRPCRPPRRRLAGAS